MTPLKRYLSVFYGALSPKLFYSYLFFLITYAGLVLIPAPQSAVLAQYKVSATGLKLIDLTIVIILAIIWFAGFYGYSKLHLYSKMIRREKDGQQMDKLTKGVFFLVMWLPISSTVSALLNLIASHHPQSLGTVTITNNYINLLLPLIGFMLIGYGAHGLRSITRRSQAKYNYILTLGLTIFLSYINVIYYHLVVSTDQRQLVYHLSFWMISLTIVAPYIFMWAIGLIAALEIYQYKKNTEGIIYKRSLTNLAIGIGWLIVTSIIFQYISTLSVRLRHLSIYLLLAIIYVLLLILSMGFVFIALGAKKLQQIEEL